MKITDPMLTADQKAEMADRALRELKKESLLMAIEEAIDCIRMNDNSAADHYMNVALDAANEL